MLRTLIAALLVAATCSHEITKRQTAKVDELADNERRVVCYYTNWSVYRKGLAKYEPQNINPYLCTHLIYAFGGMTDDFEVTTFDEYQDIEKGGYAKFNGMKQYNKGMKTLLAMGGWNEGSARFSEMVAYPEFRQNFTRSAIKHLRRYNFDGLDLDWEYPAARDGSAPEDKENYAILVEELRAAFDEEGSRVKKGPLLLTMAVPAGQKYINQGYDVPRLNKHLDFINILSYDYHSTEEPNVNHHAPLLAEPGASEYEWNAELNVDATIKYYLSKGASRTKLVMGIPTYGRTYTLLDGAFPELGASASGPGVKGNYTNEEGYMAFYEVCTAIAVDGWEVRKPYPKRIGPFAFKGNQWVGYDDEHIAARKAEYVRDEGLGGIMFWSLDSDDFRGQCNGQQYPIIESAKKAMFAPLEGAENEARSLKAASNQQNLDSQSNTSGRRRKPGRRQGPKATTIHPLITPEPPTTPATVAGFNCRREGFYPNPEDCHKYFWCLSSGASGLGIVPHSFTCPSGLIFNKKINGCDNPGTGVKCAVNVKKGPSQQTTTPIPTTTPFDYTLLDDYDYYYYDYVDEEIPEVPAKEKPAPVVTTKAPTRNSAGSQFRRPSGGAVVEPEVVESKPTNARNRPRPQYATIERERPRVPQEPEPEVREVVEESQSSRPRRPQYTTLNRNRQASLSDDPKPAERPREEPRGTTERTLEYVTIRRQRPSTTEPEIVVDATTSRSGLQYVSLDRNRTRVDDPLDDPLLDLEYDYYADLLAGDLPDPIEITTAKPQIRVPASFTRSKTRRPGPETPPEPVIPVEDPAEPPVLIPEIVSEVEEIVPEVREIVPEIQEVVSEVQEVVPEIQEVVPDVGSEVVAEVEELKEDPFENLIETIKEPEPVQPLPFEIESSPQNVVDVLEPEKERTVEIRRPPASRLIPLRTTDSTPTEVTTARPAPPRRRLPLRTLTPQRRRPPPATRAEEPATPRPPRRRLPPSRTEEPSTPRPRNRRPQNTFRRRPNPRTQQRPTEEPTTTTTTTTTTTEPITTTTIPVKPEVIDPFSVLDAILDGREESKATIKLPTAIGSEATISDSEKSPKPVRVELEPASESEIEEPVQKATLSPSRQDLFDRWRTTTQAPLPEDGKDSGVSETSAVQTQPEVISKQEESDKTRTFLRPKPVEEPEETPFSFSDILLSSAARKPTETPSTTTKLTPTRPKFRGPPRTTTTRTPAPRSSTAPAPQSTTSGTLVRRPVNRFTQRKPQPTSPTTTVRPRSSTSPKSEAALEYDYVYDYYNEGALGGDLGQLASVAKKAILASDGSVTCFDTGYFAHPGSCKMFISCSKTVRGALKGWIYTCPQELVFDPVGGMCNWTEDVDCLAN